MQFDFSRLDVAATSSYTAPRNNDVRVFTGKQ